MFIHGERCLFSYEIKYIYHVQLITYAIGSTEAYAFLVQPATGFCKVKRKTLTTTCAVSLVFFVLQKHNLSYFSFFFLTLMLLCYFYFSLVSALNHM